MTDVPDAYWCVRCATWVDELNEITGFCEACTFEIKLDNYRVKTMPMDQRLELVAREYNRMKKWREREDTSPRVTRPPSCEQQQLF